MRCPTCQQPLGPTARFCSACGTAVAVAVPLHAQQASPIETVYAPLPYAYATPQPIARDNAAPFAPAPYSQAPLEEQGSPYTPLGYAAPAAMPAYVAAPSPVQAPSMVSNVTVTQVTPPTPVPTTPPVVTEGDGGSLSVALRALYFLLSGIVAGLAWVAAAASNEPRTFLFAATMTILVLVLDIAILTRNHRR